MQNDVIIIGGSYAGLNAAMMLARARRRVVILDTQLPRNRFAHASHGFFGQDGASPKAMIEQARAKVLAYPSVRLVLDAATAARGENNHFTIETEQSGLLQSRKVILAYGVADTLPEIPGLKERWGQTVVHCPYCHGYELPGRQSVIAVGAMSAHQAMLITEWGETTFFTNGHVIEPTMRAELATRGVAIVDTPVTAIEDTATIRLANGDAHLMDAIYVGSRFAPTSAIGRDLGCAYDEGMLGTYLRTDAMRATTVPGVFAAGDITREMHNATFATADGTMAGASAHRELVFG